MTRTQLNLVNAQMLAWIHKLINLGFVNKSPK